ncbi:MAG: hypothetical protein ACLPX5_05440 [Dissulfurispiraceae bacterium]
MVDSVDLERFAHEGWPRHDAYYFADNIEEVKEALESHLKEGLYPCHSVRVDHGDQVSYRYVVAFISVMA